ncbi:hypothetical protein PMIN06_012616 [Paraphaeosphaeria minitans]|uniref:Lytic polysaccharide monooxygenase n=1 Tax=Paraphaeosphaeria minitans TaxID=565426 RepID=A0A9P6KW81_9PLEO|nr:hypothetical protein PMIN01_00203 [Paraphaeosphaeria minitans]
MFTSQALSTLAVAILSMAPVVQSHMVMASPKPFGSPDNSPLDPSGSNYPCKMTSATAGAGPMNDFAVGSKQQLSFTGSAVHGGGSCQISVTTDKNPTKDSVFKVIHSIEGGCPGVNGPATFDFTVPDALPDGDLVMAWTWFNHIGNREMYMNCANIQVSGGASDNSKLEKLPDMAIANINVGKGASCKTAEGSDYTFQGVGKDGDTVDRVGAGPFVDLCGGAATPGTGSGSDSGSSGSGSGSGSSGSGSGSANNGQYTPGAGEGDAPATSAPAVASSAPAASATGGAGGVFAPGASSAPVVSSAPAASPTDTVTSTIKTLVTVTAPSAAPTAPANGTVGAAQPTGAPAAAPTGGAAGSSCSTNGAVVCNGDSQFGLCDNGKVVWQAVAAGTKCENGQIAKRDANFTHRIQRSAI